MSDQKEITSVWNKIHQKIEELILTNNKKI